MSDETSNVIPFEPRKATPPALKYVDMKLHDEGRHISLVLFDENGDHIGVVAYGLELTPFGFDMNRLVEAWAAWRGTSTVAS